MHASTTPPPPPPPPPAALPAATLNRRLSTMSAALFGLSYICPTVIVSTFGVIAQKSQGATALAYVVATVAMLLTAGSYGRMAARYPQAGSAYTYVTRTTNPALGLMTGWILMLDYFFIPMVICLFTAKAFEVLLPAIPFQVWVVAVAACATAINLLGIKVADRVNLTIMTAQLAVMLGLVIACLAYLQKGSLVMGALSAQFSAPVAAPVAAPFGLSVTSLPAVMAGAAIACYSFLGFDAVTTLSEETTDPTRSIPRATLMAAAAGGVIFIVTAYLMARVHPSLEFKDLDNAGFEVIATAAGPLFVTLFTVVLIVSYIAAVMCAQAGSARLLYVMGRAGTLPKRTFGYLHPRFRSPSFSITLMGIVMLGGLWIDVETAATCVNFGAFSAFFAVNACVLLDHASPRRQLRGGALKLLVASAGCAASAWLIASLGKTALTVGLIWLCVGLVYIAVLTRAFRKSLPVENLGADEEAAATL